MRRKMKVSDAQLDFFSRLASTPVPEPPAPAKARRAEVPVADGARRVFLGFAQPALHGVADHLLGRARGAPLAELEHLVVAVPGKRAGRRLLEVLVERAEARGCALVPPRILAVEQLVGALAGADGERCPPLARKLAWGLTLRDAAAALRERLVVFPPAADDLPAWAALGATLLEQQDLVETAAVDFAAVAAAVRAFDDVPDEHARWDALAELEPRAAARLAALGARDPREARWAALQSELPLLPEGEEVVLACIADLPVLAARLLARLGARVTVLVHAEERDEARFDALGSVVPAAWTNAALPVDDSRVEIADGPVDQAARAVEHVAALGARSIEDVAIGVPDAEVTPHLVARLADAGVLGRDAAGTPVSRTAPYALLAAAAAFLERDEHAALAALVRHPHADAVLRAKLGCEEHEDLPAVLDLHHEAHLPQRIGSGPVGDDRAAVAARALVAAVGAWLEPLRDPTPRPLHAWAQPIVELLRGTYGRTALSRDEDEDRLVLESLGELRDALAALDSLVTTDVPATATQAIALVLADVEAREVHPTRGEPAIELLGWLDLAIDDAPVTLVTGLVEGRLPGSITAHPFLPDRLRTALGLDDDVRRHARDAHLLWALLRSREQVVLITARRDAAGDPLAPSRLLLTGDDAAVARRLVGFYEAADAPAPPPTPARLRPGRPEATLLPIAEPLPLAAPFDTIRVTAFRDYLACPYRFYLKHVEGLRPHSDAAVELDGPAFGSLAHRVLDRFGAGVLRHSTDAPAIAHFLDQTLDHEAEARYGDVAHPAVRLQLEQVRVRLHAFARVQAGLARDGYRILHAELDASATLDVDGVPVTLKGRIDRIDVGPRGLYVLDYKVPERLKTPAEAHRKGDAWKDLQLPLYRLLTARLAEDRAVVPGYFVLPRHAGDTGVLEAEWTPDEYDSAVEQARCVVRAIRAGVFGPAAAPDRFLFPEYAVLLQEGQLGERVLDDDERRAAELEG